MRETLGTVVSTMEGPNPGQIDFVINNGKAHKGMFVELEYSEGIMIAMVFDVVKTNRYFERPDSVKSIGSELEKNFPTAEWEFLIAKAKPLGIFTEKLMKRSTFPPSPGSKVFIAENENIKKFLNLDTRGLELGQIDFHDVLMKVNLSKLLQKHLAVLAMSGAGKSYFVSVLIEEILSRKKEQGQIALVAFDTHGEYTSFGTPTNEAKDYSNVTKIIDGSKLKIGVSNLDIYTISNLVSNITPKQKSVLNKILKKMRSEMRGGVGPFDLNSVKAEIIEGEIEQKTTDALVGVIDELEAMHIFSKVDSTSIFDIAKPGQLTVIDLNLVINDKIKQLVVSYFSKKLFELRRQKQIPPVSLLVEEAHNFIPGSTATENALARAPLRLIAREGRKFGASLIIVSQRPKFLDTTTLANCNTNIILRITNPNDLDHIKQSSEGLDSNSSNMISSLRVGEALIVGEAVNAPTFFKVRKRNSAPSKHELTFEEAAVRYQSETDQVDDEVDTFI
jgi:DNA helicase HerA-like ATPase